MQIDVFHGHDLGITTTGRATLDAETGPQRGLAQTDECLFTNTVHGITETDGCGRFTLARRRWADCRGQDKLAVCLIVETGDVIQ